MVCALLVAIWVSSYYKNSEATIYLGKNSDPNRWYAQIYSFQGRINVTTRMRSGGQFQPPRIFKIHYLWPALLTVVLAASPWVRWSSRYSVRAFLIVVTLIAVFLAIIMSM